MRVGKYFFPPVCWFLWCDKSNIASELFLGWVESTVSVDFWRMPKIKPMYRGDSAASPAFENVLWFISVSAPPGVHHCSSANIYVSLLLVFPGRLRWSLIKWWWLKCGDPGFFQINSKTPKWLHASHLSLASIWLGFKILLLDYLASCNIFSNPDKTVVSLEWEEGSLHDPSLQRVGKYGVAASQRLKVSQCMNKKPRPNHGVRGSG